MTLYQLTLTTHSINRWLVLGLAVVAIINSATGLKKQRFDKKDRIIHAVFLNICYLQLSLGLVLYTLSPIVTRAFEIGLKVSMKYNELRFYTVEHVLFMFIAIMLVQVGCALSKKQHNPAKKHQKALFFFIVALALILCRIPWQRMLWPI